MMGVADGGAGTISYGVVDYALLLAVVLSTVLLFVGLVSVLSAFARTIKEAGQLVTPLMVVVMVIAVLGGFMGSGASDNLLLYLVPAFNSVQCMVGIFSFKAAALPSLLTVATNLIAAGICVLALTRMFSSEHIIFSR
jgi:sodium transport system permease protein